MKKTGAARHHKDPAMLTPYESKIWELMKLGMRYADIAIAIGAASPRSIASRAKIIREKLLIAEAA